jgi:6-phosphogluconolactonase
MMAEDPPLEFEPLVDTPQPALPGRAQVREGVDEVIDAMAAEFYLQAKGCLRAFGNFQIAIAWSPENEVFFRRLMYDPILRDMPWAKTHLWILEDLRVPSDDPRSRFTAIREWIVDHADIPVEQVHPIFAMGEEPDVAYEATLREVLGWREKGHDRLDYTLLGPTPDGTTLGLYARSPALDADDRLVRVTRPPTVDVEAVSMTAHMINASRMIAILAVGQQWAGAIRGMSAPAASRREWPLLNVRPLGGELRWYLDYEACGVARAR